MGRALDDAATRAGDDSRGTMHGQAAGYRLAAALAADGPALPTLVERLRHARAQADAAGQPDAAAALSSALMDLDAWTQEFHGVEEGQPPTQPQTDPEREVLP